MICHDTRSVFVHIPKSAGQSIEHVFLERLGLNWETRAPLLLRKREPSELGPPRLSHLLAREYVPYGYLSERRFHSYFKFSFVRNPWSRLVSIYKYLGYEPHLRFRTFVTGPFRRKLFQERHWFVRPQSDFVYDDSGRLLVDFVGRMERLQPDFDEVCRRLGLPPTPVPHVNRSDSAQKEAGLAAGVRRCVPWLGQGRGASHSKDYRTYYDAEAIAVVEDLYGIDIERFGYTFDSPLALSA